METFSAIAAMLGIVAILSFVNERWFGLQSAIARAVMEMPVGCG